MQQYTKITEKSYDRVARKYHKLFGNELNAKNFDKEFLQSFTRHFNEQSILLDVGCGPSGHISRFWYNLGYNVSVIDIS